MKNLSSFNPGGRLSSEQLGYIFTSLTLPSIELKRWLYPLTPRSTIQLPFPTFQAPMICSQCGAIHGSCLGGKVWDSCPKCSTRKNYPELSLSLVAIRGWFTCTTFAEWPEGEAALILQEVYANEHHGILQYSSESARERTLYYCGDS